MQINKIFVVFYIPNEKSIIVILVQKHSKYPDITTRISGGKTAKCGTGTTFNKIQSFWIFSSDFFFHHFEKFCKCCSGRKHLTNFKRVPLHFTRLQ